MVQSCGWLLCMIASAVAAAKSSGMLMTSSTCCAGTTYCMLPHHFPLSGKSTCAVSIKDNIWQECSPASCAPSSGVPKARACARLMAATEAWSGSGFDMLGRHLDLIALISAPALGEKNRVVFAKKLIMDPYSLGRVSLHYQMAACRVLRPGPLT